MNVGGGVQRGGIGQRIRRGPVGGGVAALQGDRFADVDRLAQPGPLVQPGAVAGHLHRVPRIRRIHRILDVVIGGGAIVDPGIAVLRGEREILVGAQVRRSARWAHLTVNVIGYASVHALIDGRRTIRQVIVVRGIERIASVYGGRGYGAEPGRIGDIVVIQNTVEGDKCISHHFESDGVVRKDGVGHCHGHQAGLDVQAVAGRAAVMGDGGVEEARGRVGDVEAGTAVVGLVLDHGVVAQGGRAVVFDGQPAAVALGHVPGDEVAFEGGAARRAHFQPSAVVGMVGLDGVPLQDRPAAIEVDATAIEGGVAEHLILADGGRAAFDVQPTAIAAGRVAVDDILIQRGAAVAQIHTTAIVVGEVIADGVAE